MAWSNAELVADGKRMIDAFDPETIEYRPSGGMPRNVRALVDRASPETTPEVGQAMALAVTIGVVNQATDSDDDGYGGISSEEINIGKDRILIARRQGQTPEDRPLGEMIENDAGMIRLEVR